MAVGIDGIIFDLDGTLLDTEGISSLAIEEALAPWGCKITWDVKQKIIGMRDLDCVWCVFVNMQATF